MATQVKTQNEPARSDEKSAQQEAGSGEVPQRDAWKKVVDRLAQQFGEAIDPVLAELPQRMAKAIESNLTKDGERMAQILPHHLRESSDSRGDPQTARTRSGASKRGDDETDELAPENKRRGEVMARSSTRTEEREAQSRDDNNGSAEEKSANGKGVELRTREQNQQDNKGRETARRRSSESPTYTFDPVAASRAQLFRLAASWREQGATFQAVHAYSEILIRYPDTGAAAAASEDLLDLADSLGKEGKYYTALGIVDKVYQLV